MTVGLTTKLKSTFEEAVERTTRALADQGFGILTKIDVKATLNQKLGVDMEDYLILGACNPTLAQRALDVDWQIGQLLPCNVVVQEVGSNKISFCDLELTIQPHPYELSPFHRLPETQPPLSTSPTPALK